MRPTFTTGLAAEGQDHGHLQHHLEGVADVVGVEFLEALGAVAPLQQEGLALAASAEQGLQPRASPAKTSGG